MSQITTKLLNEYVKDNEMVKPTLLLKHYNKVIGIELCATNALREIVKGKTVLAPMKRVTGYGWVDNDLNIYHKDDPTLMVTVDNQTPSLRMKVRRAASRAFYGDILSTYRCTKLDTPSVISLIPLTHQFYRGDILLKPGAINIHFDPMGADIELPIFFKDGVMFSKHTVRKEVLERKTFTVQYCKKKYDISFRDIMYQILNFPYFDKIIVYRYDNEKPFTIDNCILRRFEADDNFTNYDPDLMMGV